MDLVLKLRELRKMSGLTQPEVAERSGIGVKTISSFETGFRIDSMKLAQLRRIIAVYGVSEEDFFGGKVDTMLEGTVPGSTESVIMEAIRKVSHFPSHVQRALAQRINDMVCAAECARQ